MDPVWCRIMQAVRKERYEKRTVYVATGPPYGSRILCVSNNKDIARQALLENVESLYQTTFTNLLNDKHVKVTKNGNVLPVLETVECTSVPGRVWTIQQSSLNWKDGDN